MSINVSVIMVTEGTYPYNEGGVSTWSYILCEGVQGGAKYTASC